MLTNSTFLQRVGPLNGAITLKFVVLNVTPHNFEFLIKKS